MPGNLSNLEMNKFRFPEPSSYLYNNIVCENKDEINKNMYT